MNPKHYDLARKGMLVWNAWRKDNPTVKPDLRGANLRGINLEHANLRDTDLSRADLSYAYLNHASFGGARGVEANFREASLEDAFFKGGYFEKADFREAQLTDAVFQGTPFIGHNTVEGFTHGSWFTKAIFDGADLSLLNAQGAMLWEASFVNCVMKEAQLTNAQLHNANLEHADLTNADLQSADLYRANLNHAIFQKANLERAQMVEANLDSANFSEANLMHVGMYASKGKGTIFYKASLFEARLASIPAAVLIKADFRESDLGGMDLSGAVLKGANLQGANLTRTIMVETDIQDATLRGARVYGVSAWNIKGKPKNQNDLIITPANESIVTTDDLEVAQFVYLLLHNEKIRSVINEITSKAILILGRFSPPDRKMILDSLKGKLRSLGFLPIIFDFERPTDKDFTETLMTLAGLSLFVIADVTNPKSSPLELQTAVPDYQIPFVPIIQHGEKPFSMLANLQSKYDWVLDTFEYKNEEDLMDLLEDAVINRALKKHVELRNKKMMKPKLLTAEDFRS